MLELILQVNWALIMHEEEENHLEQEILPNSLNEPSLASKPVNGASARSERSEAERCGASERSEWCKRTNVASDRGALSKRDCHD